MEVRKRQTSTAALPTSRGGDTDTETVCGAGFHTLWRSECVQGGEGAGARGGTREGGPLGRCGTASCLTPHTRCARIRRTAVHTHTLLTAEDKHPQTL